ncbi:MAG: helix-turn-helix domain-containing protein [Clostridia bacterium]|nr:helix-turn-helix domain-containing protein [Clostridia bacterium]
MSKTGEQIQLARLKQNLSTKDLAKKVGLTANYIEDIETGKKIINESIANRIFKALGVSTNVLSQEAMAKVHEPKPAPKPVIPKKVEHHSIDHAPSWNKALDNIIRKYPVYNAHTKKHVEDRTIPTLDTKVEGYHCDKITFIQVFDNTMSRFNILEDDVLMLFLTQDITNDKIYYFEYENRPYIRKLRKESNKKISLYSDEVTTTIDQDKIKLIGKVVKLERKMD